MSKFDFYPDFIDFNIFLAEELAWQVVNGDVFNINNMTDEELRCSIIDDVLAVTIWEKQTGEKVKYDISTLTRYLTDEQCVRVMEAMKHESIVGLFDLTADHVRIVDSKEVLQAAMAYAEVWYTGYDMPDGLYTVNREVLKNAVEINGGIDNLAQGLLMDMSATHEPTKTLN